MNKAEYILGLQRPYTIIDVKTKWRKKIKENHPDVGGCNDITIELNMAKVFIENQLELTQEYGKIYNNYILFQKFWKDDILF